MIINQVLEFHIKPEPQSPENRFTFTARSTVLSAAFKRKDGSSSPLNYLVAQSPMETLLPMLPQISLRSPHQISFAGSTLLLALFNCLL